MKSLFKIHFVLILFIASCSNKTKIVESSHTILQNRPTTMNFRNQESIDKFEVELNIYEGNIRIGLSNSDITNLDRLMNLREIKGNLIIEDNPILNSLEGLRNLTKVGGELRIANNESLSNLAGLESIREIGGSLVILRNNNLKNLASLRNLEKINGALFISHNNSLVNLSGLNKLEIINGRLQVTNNGSLVSLEGLNIKSGIKNNDESFMQGLIIRYNPKLSHCSLNSICNSFKNEKLRYDISNNSDGCNSKSEVIDNCEE